VAKLTTSTISGGFQTTSELNENFLAIITALENTLSRDGTTPNQMSADIDMNGNDLLNVGDIYIDGVNIITAMQTLYDNYVAITTDVTISTASPSGGEDGDIWYKVSE